MAARTTRNGGDVGLGLKTGLGLAFGLTAFDGEDAGPFPAEFVAVTVKLYGTPSSSPGTMHGLESQLPLIPPGEEVAL